MAWDLQRAAEKLNLLLLGMASRLSVSPETNAPHEPETPIVSRVASVRSWDKGAQMQKAAPDQVEAACVWPREWAAEWILGDISRVTGSPLNRNRVTLAILEDTITTEKTNHEKNGANKSVVDEMTDLVAGAAGALAETAVKAVAKKTERAIAKRIPVPVKKAAKTVAKAAKAPKKSAKETAKKAPKKTAKKSAPKKFAKKAGPKKAAKKSKKARRSWRSRLTRSSATWNNQTIHND
jgi:hypothetical protein